MITRRNWLKGIQEQRVSVVSLLACCLVDSCCVTCCCVACSCCVAGRHGMLCRRRGENKEKKVSPGFFLSAQVRLLRTCSSERQQRPLQPPPSVPQQLDIQLPERAWLPSKFVT